MKKINPKAIVKFVGVILTLASLYFLLQSFFEHSEKVLGIFSRPIYSVILLIGILIYCITFLIMVHAWFIQLNDNYPQATYYVLFRIMGISQIAKYLPGNVFHLASRFYLTINTGIKPKVITNSLIFETILVILSAVLVSGIYLHYYSFPIFKLEFNIYILIIMVLVVMMILYFLNLKNSFIDLLSGHKIIFILALFLCSHFFNGAIIYLINSVIFEEHSSIFILTSMLAMSFVVGYVTPGSPGGIGIREFVFVKLAVTELDESVALSLILSLRLVSICGDLLIYVISMRMKNQLKTVA